MAQQPIDASAIPIPSLDASALSAGAGCLRGDGGRIRQTGADVRSSWAGLAGVYRAPEDAQLFAVMDPVAIGTDSFASDVERVASILESFAAEAGPLAATLVNAQSEAYAFAAKIAGNGKWDHDGGLVKQNNALVHTVNTTLVAYQAAERRAANAIEALMGGHTWHVIDPKTGSPKDPYAYGYTSIPDNAKTPWGADVQKKDGCFKSALTDVGHFAEGVGEGLWGMVKGVGTLVWDATGAGGWDKFKQAWEGLAFLSTLITPGFGPLAGMAIWGPKGYAQRVEAMGKGLVDWNEWKTDPAKAAGNVTATVATLFIPGAGEVGAVADGAKGAELAADAGKAAEVASDAGKLSKAADLGMTGLRVVSDPLGFALKGLPKVIDLANTFKIKLAGLDTVVGHDGSLIDHEMGGWTSHADQPVAVGAHDGEPAMVGAHTGSGVDAGTGVSHDAGTGLGHDSGGGLGHGGSGIGHDTGPGAGHGGGDHGGVDASSGGHGGDAGGNPAGAGTTHAGTGDHPGLSDKPWDQQTPAEQMATAQHEVDTGAKTFSNDAAAASYGAHEWNIYAEHLPQSEQQALHDYTLEHQSGADGKVTDPDQITYTEINGYLRHGGEANPTVLHDIQEIDKALAGHPTPEALVITRGTGISHLKVDDPRDLVGEDLTDRAYNSASLGGPADAFKDLPAVIHARVPAGTPAIWVEKVGAFGAGERELLLGRNLTLHVDQVTMSDNGQWQIYGHYLSVEK